MDISTKTHPLLSNLNSPDVTGVVPGSLRVREDVRRINARLQTSQQFNFDASPLSLDGALVGSRCELVAVCTAKAHDGTDITSTDPIGLREEASNIIWRDLTLVINGQEITHNVRADIVRHVLDRYHQGSRLTTPSLTEYRQLGADSELVSPAGVLETGMFKNDMIYNSSRFELIRPLNDLPFFAEGDSMIPGFNTIQIRALTTSEPQALFKTTSAVTDAPYLVVEEMKLRYTTVKLEAAIARELQSLSAAGELELTGSLWSAVNLTPRIDAGSRRWIQGVATAFGTTPDLAYFMAFPEVSFIPGIAAYSDGAHPLQHTWAALSDIQFTSGSGEEIRHYRNVDGIGGKVKILQETKKSLSDQGGVVADSGALGDVCAITPQVFVAEPGLGAAPLYMRNWAETETHAITPMTLRVQTDLNDPAYSGAPLASQPYLISKSRHRWVLSTTPGATRIVV